LRITSVTAWGCQIMITWERRLALLGDALIGDFDLEGPNLGLGTVVLMTTSFEWCPSAQ
jgi:hypothetical protein